MSIPVIASLNGSSPGGWVRYSEYMEQAGADALELNIFDIPTDPALTAEQLETRYCDLVRAIRKSVRIPIAVKLGPYFTSCANFAKRLVGSRRRRRRHLQSLLSARLRPGGDGGSAEPGAEQPA